ncbi:sulfurtransferase TusA family protein [Acinetobacter qingfengensis]|uniref:UPF0033 domain-containing protein n=1 Tax=Acinetobacter qingfengensis TaxID=1262585 RepID=A0A1E7QZ13_9GAMM|nr:sulfurtransferase TusA family protein [Acinetobacter qingfengensis]KAA8730969.1 sulfurtransferase TusA family protein [Acinetobacter qingfengensis]OEY92315.1 hypothetical protein BJI46_05745 [Acinetobacter qingfengensis]
MSESNFSVDHEIDARQQPCPMPILMLKRTLKIALQGQILLVKATDPNSQQDLIHFCKIQNLNILQMTQQTNEFHYYIEKS